MTTLQKDALLQKRGQDLYDRDGDKIGAIEEIYLDAQTGEPEWALVNTGMFGTKSSFVPLQEADEDGGTLRVPYEKARVKDAPTMDPDGELSQNDESKLYAHYGLDYGEHRSGSGLPEGDPAPAAAVRPASAAPRRSAATPRGPRPTTP
jgi:sporulation protein YlmC with PRC-barrel domain